MIDRTKLLSLQLKVEQRLARLWQHRKENLDFSWCRNHPIQTLAGLAIILFVLYWSVIASDRYVSQARVIIQSPDLASGQVSELNSLIGNINSGNQTDQLLLREYLLSVDMLKKLDAKLDLRSHYSDPERDFISRMWDRDNELEWFHRHYLSRVSVEYDEYAGVLVINTQAYEPAMAHAISSTLLEEGERFMNILAQNLAMEQVKFLEGQVDQMSERVKDERQALLNYQDKVGLASPQSTAENLVQIINKMEGELAGLQANRSAMLGYLMADSPSIIEINMQISALKNQIKEEKSRLTSMSGKTLNKTVEEYQRLEMNVGFAQDIYKTAIVALEKGRIEASRTLKKMSILQAPTVPEYPLEPARIYNTVLSTIVILLIAGVLSMLNAIIRDHKD